METLSCFKKDFNKGNTVKILKIVCLKIMLELSDYPKISPALDLNYSMKQVS